MNGDCEDTPAAGVGVHERAAGGAAQRPPLQQHEHLLSAVHRLLPCSVHVDVSTGALTDQHLSAVVKT
jgi:hypothetical protein